MKNEQDLLIKAWDTYQRLIESVGEVSWKIRSVFYTAAFGLIAAAFSSDLLGLYLLNPPLAILFCFLEAGYQQIQQQYIDKTTKIEDAINDMWAQEEEIRRPSGGIGTSLEPPSLKSLLAVFTWKKYLFWLSYLIVILISLVLFAFSITNRRFAAPSSPCPAVCCPCNSTPSPTASTASG